MADGIESHIGAPLTNRLLHFGFGVTNVGQVSNQDVLRIATFSFDDVHFVQRTLRTTFMGRVREDGQASLDVQLAERLKLRLS